VDATVNFHIPPTALLCFGTIPKIDSSNYTIELHPAVWTTDCANV